jgi:hypothetical protein
MFITPIQFTGVEDVQRLVRNITDVTGRIVSPDQPFVDVMLVLLIIFMVAAPMLTTGIEVDLPDSNAAPLKGQDEPIAVSVKKNGDIYIQESKIDLEPAKEFLRKRKEAIRSQLRTWVDSVSAQSTAQLELLPEETRTQMMEDLRDFADLLAESSTQGLILFSSESLDFQNPFMDRGSELLLSGDTRLFRARTEFFRRGGLKTSLDYPLN